MALPKNKVSVFPFLAKIILRFGLLLADKVWKFVKPERSMFSKALPFTFSVIIFGESEKSMAVIGVSIQKTDVKALQPERLREEIVL
ncbi:hypothetical protein D3C85_1324920 [compost metagenome]